MPADGPSPALDKRHEFVLFFDVQDGNPNGDPDAGNAPRIDPETGHGLVTDVCLKRKVRNFVQLSQAEGDGAARKPRDGFEIYVKERGILALQQKRAYDEENLPTDGKPATVQQARRWMCRTFYDVRAFGAVMSTGKVSDKEADALREVAGGGEPSAGTPDRAEPPAAGSGRQKSGAKAKADGPQRKYDCGQVRGPVQLSFARSVDPIVALEHAITRVALTNPGDTRRGQEIGDEQEATSLQMGRKATIPYALYRAHGFVSPFLARDTGFSRDDLGLLWTALAQMFEHDRSASRGVMAARALIVFEHASALGDQPAHRLFERVTCRRKTKEEGGDLGKPARGFGDYRLDIDRTAIDGVTVHDLIGGAGAAGSAPATGG
jgi:CRISPR-associated protein Csd2